MTNSAKNKETNNQKEKESEVPTNHDSTRQSRAQQATPTIETALALSFEQPTGDGIAVLRTETALSRFPLHRLTKGKSVEIELTNQASAVLWRVDHTTRYGQPGALAYKLDSLYINRRIEDSGRPVPKTIRLGSLREIAQEIGSGTNTTPVKQALLQNATASITAKISYRTQEGNERWLEAVFNRYSVVFTGEKLPQGETADAVYLVLNDIYQEILNTAVYRPLDYDYMKVLPPISQRFYEIVSYQIYAALRHNNPRAKVAYSDYCLLSTATRYPDFEHIKKQMYKVVRPHIQSGYIAKVEYEAITNERGEADWMMYLTPGPNANREYRAFTGQGQMRKPKRKGKSKGKETSADLTLPFPETSGLPENQQTRKPEEKAIEETTTKNGDTEPTAPGRETQTIPDSPHHALVESLVQAELNRGDAERLAREKPEECRRQLEFLPHVKAFKTSRGAYLRRAIEEGYGPPKSYSQAQLREESAQLARRQRGQATLQATEEKARQSHEKRHSEAFAIFLGEWVGEWEKTQPEAFIAFQRYEEEKRSALVNGPLAQRELGKKAIEAFDLPTVRADRIGDFCQHQGHRFGLRPLTFWEWDETHNPEPFQL